MVVAGETARDWQRLALSAAGAVALFRRPICEGDFVRSGCHQHSDIRCRADVGSGRPS
jgi:hypothetical protein